MKCNYILGLDEADMKKIRGFRLRLVNFFSPALVDVLRRTAETKAYYLLKYKDEIELNRSLEKEINELKWDINKLTAELNELKEQSKKDNELEGSSEVSGN